MKPRKHVCLLRSCPQCNAHTSPAESQGRHHCSWSTAEGQGGESSYSLLQGDVATHSDMARTWASTHSPPLTVLGQVLKVLWEGGWMTGLFFGTQVVVSL